MTRRTAFVKWDLGLLSSSTILGANYAAYNVYSFSCQPRWFGVYRVADPWDPATLTWNNQPRYGPTVLGAHNASHGHEGLGCGDAWVNTSMTGMVQNWVDGVYPNHGITVRVAQHDDYTDEYTYKHFASREAGGQVLSIFWTPYRAGYALGDVDNDLGANSVGHMDIRVTNKSFMTWNAGGANPFKLSYHVYAADGTTLLDWDGRRTDLGADLTKGSRWLTAEVDPLAPGTYQLKWEMVHLGSGGQGWFTQQGVHPDLTPMAVNVTVPNHKAYIEEASPGGTVASRTPTLSVVGRNPDGWPAGGLQAGPTSSPAPGRRRRPSR